MPACGAEIFDLSLNPKETMSTEPTPNEIERWTAQRKAAVVLELIKGKTTAAEVARQHGLTVADVEQWKDVFIQQGTEALQSNPRDVSAQHEAEKKDLLAKVGELILHVEVLKKRTAFAGRNCRKGSRERGAQGPAQRGQGRGGDPSVLLARGAAIERLLPASAGGGASPVRRGSLGDDPGDH